MHYTLRQIEVFLATAHYENVTQAAASLSMSQSAASSALQDLEHRFDVQLFDRAGKRLQLSELGKTLRPRAEALMAQAREFERGLTLHSDVGDLKVGATLTIGNYLVVPIMANFMGQHSGSRVSLTVENTVGIANRVRNFELDIGLIEGELQDPVLEVIPWRDDELMLFCAPEHPLASRGVLSDADLLECQWIVREAGSGTRQAFDRAMHGLLPDLNIRLELQHTEAIKCAVEANLGIGCLSAITLREAFTWGTLIKLQAPQRDWTRKFYFILHRQKYRSAGIQSWLDLCRDYPD
ncbi:MAG: LysR substrate-binding domain-containing protein [Gammaproteobacteria bacterium]|nr:LysR substrate-binding domain-containing protein [Gammaproteobacteria bacterium]MDP2348416.1 LysR substrate-binding domain-containing protein [Gammaproteobacteria bacterium]